MFSFLEKIVFNSLVPKYVIIVNKTEAITKLFIDISALSKLLLKCFRILHNIALTSRSKERTFTYKYVKASRV